MFLGKNKRIKKLKDVLILYKIKKLKLIFDENLNNIPIEHKVYILCFDMDKNLEIKDFLLQKIGDEIKIVLLNNKYIIKLFYYHLLFLTNISIEEHIEIFLPLNKEKYRKVLHNILKIKSFQYELVFDNTIPMYESSFGEIPNLLKNDNVAVLDRERKSKLLSTSIVIPKEINRNNKVLEFISPSNIFFTSSSKNFSEGVKSVSIPHSLILKPISKEILVRNFLLADYICLPTQTQFKYVKNLMIENLDKINKQLCLIPLGYPKLEKLEKDLVSSYNNEKNAICYAPTLLTHNDEFLATLSLKNGIEIIDFLLNNFEYNVIFRPHPLIIQSEVNGKQYVLDILKTFGNNPRFIYDDSSYYAETFSKTLVMISDFSSTMQTFAFATLQPFIALSNSNFDKLYYNTFNDEDIRLNCGLVVNTLEELKKKFKYLVNNMGIYKQKILEYKNNELFNLNCSSEYIANNLIYIKNNIKNSDWYYLKFDE
ncbi:MAG: hypothetical protein ACNI3C_05215 [Candidatus Marinarcus sp.]|uniref:hypothetical protein n=1 Tax=Candidatus Marinarcus sp. TaxID=3100987 RepID=UPI003B00F074